MEEQRWGDTPACPRCGDTEVVQMKAKDGTRNARFLVALPGLQKTVHGARGHDHGRFAHCDAPLVSRVLSRCFVKKGCEREDRELRPQRRG